MVSQQLHILITLLYIRIEAGVCRTISQSIKAFNNPPTETVETNAEFFIINTVIVIGWCYKSLFYPFDRNNDQM